MAIDPANTDAVAITQLDDLILALNTLLVGSNADGKMGKFTAQTLANFIAPYLSSYGDTPFVSNTGSPLPNPIDKATAITFVGTGNFDQTTGANVVTTEELNALFWSSNGTTGTWVIGVAIPINLTDYLLKTDIVNDLTTGGTTKPLSAEQGKTLNANFLKKIVTYGAVDSTYTNVVSTTITAANNRPFKAKGVLKTIKIYATAAGTIKFNNLIKGTLINQFIVDPATSPFTYTAASSGVKTLVAGTDFPAGIVVYEGGLISAYLSASGGAAKIGRKLTSNPGGTLSIASDISGTFVFTGIGFTSVLGMYFEVEEETLLTKISNNETNIVSLKESTLIDRYAAFINKNPIGTTAYTDYPMGTVGADGVITLTTNPAFRYSGQFYIPSSAEKLYFNNFKTAFRGAFYDINNAPILPTFTAINGDTGVAIPSGAVFAAVNLYSSSNIGTNFPLLFYGYKNKAGFIDPSNHPLIYPDQYNWFKNKIGVFMGDSIVDRGNYPELIGDHLQCITYNVGQDGTKMANDLNPAAEPLSLYNLAQSIVSRDFTSASAAASSAGARAVSQLNKLIAIDFSTVDFLSLAYLTNDFSAGYTPLGTNTDTSYTTIKGAVNFAINTLMTAYPNLKIFLISPTHRYFGTPATSDSDLVANSSGLFLKQYVDALIEVGNLNHLPVYDMYRLSGLNKYNHTRYFADGVHPLDGIGFEYWATKIGAFLLSNS